MFGFDMIGTYEIRKVARDQFDWGFVSTCRVTDGEHPFETAVMHSAYSNGRDADMVIVAAYDSRSDAEAGHRYWIKKMTSDPLPLILTDVSNSLIQQIIGPESRTRK